MNLTEQIKNIPRGQCVIISPPNVQVMITGVQYIAIERNKTVTLHYVDGSIEAGKLEIDKINDETSFFNIVGMIQGQRTNS